jgi:hypothetical protein
VATVSKRYIQSLYHLSDSFSILIVSGFFELEVDPNKEMNNSKAVAKQVIVIYYVYNYI